MLVKQNPRLLAIDPDFGVATRPAHDFFKPNRKVTKREIISEVINLLPDVSAEDFNLDQLLGKLAEGIDCNGVLDCRSLQQPGLPGSYSGGPKRLPPP